MRWLKPINIWVGRVISWLALALVLTQFAVVVLRYVFATGSIGLQESVWYMHGLIFLLGAGFTLATDDHVRMDVIYRHVSIRTRSWVDLIGAVFLLLPFCAAMIWFFANVCLERVGCTRRLTRSQRTALVMVT